MRFGRLTVLRSAKNIGKRTAWLCVCDCGNEKAIVTDSLIHKKTLSCGCLMREMSSKARKKEATLNTYEFCDGYVVGNLYGGHTFMVDYDDFDRIKDIKWSMTKNGYVEAHNVDGKHIKLHRFITNCPKGKVVDHINHNLLDNRKSNLRICDQKDNSKNTKLRYDNKSGYAGVDYRKDFKKWRARICVDYKMIHLGLFDTKEEAIEARQKAEIEYFKEFRCGYVST
jgi:hypothetical protein